MKFQLEKHIAYSSITLGVISGLTSNYLYAIIGFAIVYGTMDPKNKK
ncbi:hypothetical protein RZE82_00510 [Mollicutes bacterium LVI A0039]|nr:hypothetical protein RZE82_00510 [Mollicutes bacterium LVI A0039]